jgi:hypothetical protein
LTRIITHQLLTRRSQWPGSVTHEMPSPAQTLGSWVRTPLKAWMSTCVYSRFMRQQPCDRLIPCPRSHIACLRLRNWNETKRFTYALCSKWEQQEQKRERERIFHTLRRKLNHCLSHAMFWGYGQEINLITYNVFIIIITTNSLCTISIIFFDCCNSGWLKVQITNNLVKSEVVPEFN